MTAATPEPTPVQFRAALEAVKRVMDELEVEWTAHKPIQGEGTLKVIAWEAAKATLADRGAALDQARRDGAAEALREAANEIEYRINLRPSLHMVVAFLRTRAADVLDATLADRGAVLDQTVIREVTVDLFKTAGELYLSGNLALAQRLDRLGDRLCELVNFGKDPNAV